MKKLTIVILLASHVLMAGVGFGLGIYMLPILIAPDSPSAVEVETIAAQAMYTTTFTKNLKGSDAFHWGEGDVSIDPQTIALNGALAPGPDYRLYLSPTFVQDETEFLAIKDSAVEVGMVNTFDPSQYTTVVVWCESFGEFITSGEYR